MWLERSLYLAAACIALVGLADAIYLSVEHLAGQNVDCIASTGCQTVLGSSYATIGKVPLAAFGAVAYFAVFSLSILGAFGQAGVRLLFVPLVGTMLAMTCWLFYLQAFVLHAFCTFCLLSAAITVLLAAIGGAILLLQRRQLD